MSIKPCQIPYYPTQVAPNNTTPTTTTPALRLNNEKKIVQELDQQIYQKPTKNHPKINRKMETTNTQIRARALRTLPKATLS